MQEKNQDHIINNHRIATALHDTGSKNIVIFCHGFRSTNIGPNRFFVRAARKIANEGISSLRFDQYGSGNSDGDFIESSFNDWLMTIEAFVKKYTESGYRVALFGQSMGAAASLVVASRTQDLTAVVAWVPDPNIEGPLHRPNEILEEGGQRVMGQFWKEASEARVADRVRLITAPVYIVQCEKDEYVDAANRQAIEQNKREQHRVETFPGLLHSNWSYAASEEIITKSVDFLTGILKTK